MAEKVARSAEACTKLIAAAHGTAVKTLKDVSNAMAMGAKSAREADRMLAGDRAGKRVSSYDVVKADVARQVQSPAKWPALLASHHDRPRARPRCCGNGPDLLSPVLSETRSRSLSTACVAISSLWKQAGLTSKYRASASSCRVVGLARCPLR